MSQSQLHHYFALSLHDLPNSLASNVIIRPNRNSFGLEIRETIVVAEKRSTRGDDGNLNHLLLTAQIRHDLGKPADDSWMMAGLLSRRFEQPDAVHILPNGSMEAIEADAGEYNLTVVLRKLQGFKDQGYERVRWGCISPVRARNLEAKVRKIDRQLLPELQTVKWWDLPAP